MAEIFPNGWLWNQADLEPGSNLNGVLVTLVAFMPNRSPRIVGTGFALNVEDGDVAIFCTAAHVVEFAAELQQKQTHHHATALPEFLPPRAPLQLAPEVLRALYFDGTQVEMAVVDWIVWDEKHDLSIFGVRAQAPGTAQRFRNDLRLTGSRPDIGTRVAILRLDGMEVVDEDRDGAGTERFAIARRLVLRAGVISSLHPGGHALCRGLNRPGFFGELLS